MAVAPNFSTILAILALMMVVSTSAIAAYRLLLSPLAHFPGPKLAALNRWYETYFDCFKHGRYWFEIEEMHKKYGPIVRISPWEIHVDDPDWNEPYKITSRVDKYSWFYDWVNPGAALGTADHDIHRVRRRAQQGYFTQDAVFQFEPNMNIVISKLLTRLEEFKGTGKPVNLSNAYRSLATDVVTEYSFHKSYNLLDSPDFAASFHKAIRDFSEIGIWNRHFGLILSILESIPKWLVAMMNPAGAAVQDLVNDIDNRTNSVVAAYNKSGIPDANRNIIHEMLESPDLPTKDKEARRLALETRTIVAAGTETTGNNLSVATYHLLANPEKAKLLKDEIQTAVRQSKRRLNLQELQSLPYLSSIVCETLRISSSVSGRLPRVNTREALKYKTYTIPIGTPVSTTQQLTHNNPTIFPSPRAFLPERWLDPVERKQLEKYLQPFGRGSRACLGIYLAYAELYATLAVLFDGSFEMNLFDTERKDIDMAHDFMAPWPESTKGLRVTIE